MVWVRALDTLESQPLPGTENAILTGNIFWSADSRAIAFVADNKLKSIEVASGRAVRTIADVPGGIGGGTWNADGVIVFSRFQSLSRLSAPGAAPTSLTTPAGNGDLYLSPVFLPDGRHLLYTLVSRGGAFARIATLEGTVVREYPIERGAGVVYADGHPAHLLSARGETLLGQPVDETTFEPLGESFVVADGLSLATAPGASPTLFSVASNGTLAYLTGDVFRPTQLTWFDRSGASLGMVGSEAVYNDLSLSPDDTRLAVTKRDANDDIWIVDLARNVPSPFTRDPAQDWHPVWSPDGKWLSFSSTRRLGGSTNSLFVKETINVGAERLVMESDANERVNDWSPDGKLLLVNRTQGRDGLWVVPVNPGTATAQAKVTEYLNSPSFSETRGQFYPVSDPKGRSWISYTSNESGAFEIYVESYPRGSQKEQISTKGGTQPRWRRDGKELYYISPDLKMMAVDVTPGDRLTFGQPKELFQTRISLGGTLAFRMLRYDVTRDGKRFLINSEREGFEPLSPLITVVLNWTAALKN
jgi:Tol biopolymer transport system component